MAIHECRATVKAGLGAELDAFLAESGEDGWMVIEDVVAGSAVLVGYFETEAAGMEAWTSLAVRVGSFLESSSPVFRRLEDRDWKLSYRDHFKPWHSGPVHWVPVWERDSYALPAGDVAIWLDPGMAFGTGNHETTRLCLERMTELADKWKRAGRALDAIGVIDAGCGSGILALSAAALGMGPVRAFDIDAEAVDVSRENAVLNSLSERIIFEHSDLPAGLAGRQASLVLANILAPVLLAQRRVLLDAVATGGRLVLSGILASEVAQVERGFLEAGSGFRSSSRTMGEWADLVLERR